MAAESKDLFAFRRGFTDLLPNRSLDYARDDSLVRNLKQLAKLQFGDFSYPPPICHPERSSHLAAKSKDLFAFSGGISNLIPNRSLDALRLLGMTVFPDV